MFGWSARQITENCHRCDAEGRGARTMRVIRAWLDRAQR